MRQQKATVKEEGGGCEKIEAKCEKIKREETYHILEERNRAEKGC